MQLAKVFPGHTEAGVYHGTYEGSTKSWDNGHNMWNGGLLSTCRLRNLPGGDDACFGLLMGPLGIKLVGRARPLEQLALMRAILTS